jgi:DnaJ-class molecular chaperone
MRMKTSASDLITKMTDDSAYVILGIDSDASDNEIKKAYKLV